MNAFALLLLLVILAGYPVSASAEFYRYYDESGGITVTNDYKSIPERYRATVTVVTEKELENKAKAREMRERTENGRAAQRQHPQPHQALPAQSVTSGQTPTPLTDRKETASTPAKNDNWFTRQLPLLKVTGIIVLFIAGFIFVGRFVSSLAPRPLAIIIRIALFAALAVYLFKGYAEKVVDAFSRIKVQSDVAQKAVDKRSEKIQQQAE
jgi:hypothetical protein